jgi:hypothetical protein
MFFVVAFAAACVITAQDNFAWVCPGDTRTHAANYFLLAPGSGSKWLRNVASINSLTFLRNGATMEDYPSPLVIERGVYSHVHRLCSRASPFFRILVLMFFVQAFFATATPALSVTPCKYLRTTVRTYRRAPATFSVRSCLRFRFIHVFSRRMPERINHFNAAERWRVPNPIPKHHPGQYLRRT